MGERHDNREKTMARRYFVAAEGGTHVRKVTTGDVIEEGASVLVVRLPDSEIHVIRQQSEDGPLQFKFLPDGVLAVEADGGEFGPLIWYRSWISAEIVPYVPTASGRATARIY